MATRFHEDGQLAGSSSTLHTADRYSEVIGLLLYSTNTRNAELVQLTLTRNVAGGTAHMLFRIVLGPREQVHLGGIGMDPGDVLSAWAGSDDTVDYLLSRTNSREDLSLSARPNSDKFQFQARSSTGAIRRG